MMLCRDMLWEVFTLFYFLGLGGGQEPLSPPSVNDQGQPVLGFPFSLSCIALRLPVHVRLADLTFTWFKDDMQLEGARDLTLTFDQVKRSDEGRYTCRVSLGSPQTTSPQSKPFHLGVLVHPNVTIEQGSVVKVALGGSLTLTCVVREAYPRVLDDGYSWSYRPSSSTEWQSLANRGRSLIFTNVTREVGGHYRCQARNDAGVEGKIPPGEASVSVEVLYLENIALTSDLEVNEGDHVTLTCKVESNPPANLTWIVGGREVRHVTYNVDHYVLERAACSDNKTYTCRASNAELRGLELNKSTHVLVRTAETVPPDVSTTLADLVEAVHTATFHVRLSYVSVLSISHPIGQELMSWHKPCRCDVTEAFERRVTDVKCDATARVLAFSLGNISCEDYGEYKYHALVQEKYFNGSVRLALKGHDRCDSETTDAMEEGNLVPLVAAVVFGVTAAVYVIISAVVLIIRLKRQRELSPKKEKPSKPSRHAGQNEETAFVEVDTERPWSSHLASSQDVG